MRKNKKDKRRDKKKGIELRFVRKKTCRFCKNKNQDISYRDSEFLNNFITERGRIIPGRISGNCAKHQRMVARAIKRAREIALLPFCG